MSDLEVKKCLEDMLAGRALTFDPVRLESLTPGMQSCIKEVKNLIKRLKK